MIFCDKVGIGYSGEGLMPAGEKGIRGVERRGEERRGEPQGVMKCVWICSQVYWTLAKPQPSTDQ